MLWWDIVWFRHRQATHQTPTRPQHISLQFYAGSSHANVCAFRWTHSKYSKWMRGPRLWANARDVTTLEHFGWKWVGRTREPASCRASFSHDSLFKWTCHRATLLTMRICHISQQNWNSFEYINISNFFFSLSSSSSIWILCLIFFFYFRGALKYTQA